MAGIEMLLTEHGGGSLRLRRLEAIWKRPNRSWARISLAGRLLPDTEQRDAIYSQLRTDITGFNDIELNLRSGDFEAARRQSQRMADDARLLDDLGWEDDPGREEFTLTMPPADLARLLSRLNDDAGHLVRAHVLDPIEEREHAAELLLAQSTYSAALAQLVGE